MTTNRLEVVGASYDPEGVSDTHCAADTDPAMAGSTVSARYPALLATMRTWPPVGNSGRWPQMRWDGAAGLVLSHETGEGGATFHVDAGGAKRKLPLPYAKVFDVDTSANIWFVHEGALKRGTLDGQVTILAPEAGALPPADGPLGSSPLGLIGQIAAGKDKVYLLNEEQALVPDPRSYLPPTMARVWRVLERGSSGSWQVRTLPQMPGLQPSDVVSALRVGPGDSLFVLVNQPFWQILAEARPPSMADYRALASVWRYEATAGWSQIAAREYSLRVPVALYANLEYDFDAKDLAVSSDGKIFVGGMGAIHTVDATNGWQQFASAEGHDAYDLGRDGDASEATLAAPVQLVSQGSTLSFYDGETCQIRRWQGGRLSTFSGPRVQPSNYRLARFVGLDRDGSVLVGERSRDDVNFSYSRYGTSSRMLRVTVGGNTDLPQHVRSLNPALPANPQCIYGYHPMGLGQCSLYAPAEPFSAWLGVGSKGVIAQWRGGIYSGLSDSGAAAGALLSDTKSWPGVLEGGVPDAAGGFQVDGDWVYVYAVVRTEPPPAQNVYIEPRLYAINLNSGVASAVAGATIGSAFFGGAKIDLAQINPMLWQGPLLVQRRSDGAFWLASGKEIWLLETSARLRRVAGLSSSGGAGVDGTGAAASFASISGMRVLPDDRLVVADRGAHAIRLVNSEGTVTSIVGRLNQPGFALGELPGGLIEPTDVLIAGRDLYISTAGRSELLRARGAL